MKMAGKMINVKSQMGRVWHPLRVRCVSAHYPGVSRGSTPGYSLPTRWVGAAGNPEGCEIVAGGRSQAKTSGFHSQPVMHPGGVTELLMRRRYPPTLLGCGFYAQIIILWLDRRRPTHCDMFGQMEHKI
jgi:hypothetical protein